MADYNAQLVTQTVGDEIAFSLETSGLNAQEIIKRRRELLASVGLSDKEDMPIQLYLADKNNDLLLPL